MDTALIEAAQRITPLVRACGDEGERERRLPAQVLAAMHEARLFRMYIPKALDGLEIDPITSMIVVEEIARADAAAAWNLMLGATYGLWAAFLPEDAAREIYSASDAVVAGALRPIGRARPVDGGFVVDGRWSFASGIRHSAWWNAGCLVEHDGGDKDAPRPPAPEARLVFFPAADGKLIENWDVGGLRGTGSHDYAVSGLFVPEPRAIPFDGAPRALGAPVSLDPGHDAVLALQRWVEEGVAPDMLIATTDQPLATHASENTTQPAAFTRPLCPYPEEAQYKGVGDTTDAANFVCVGRGP